MILCYFAPELCRETRSRNGSFGGAIFDRQSKRPVNRCGKRSFGPTHWCWLPAIILLVNYRQACGGDSARLGGDGDSCLRRIFHDVQLPGRGPRPAEPKTAVSAGFFAETYAVFWRKRLRCLSLGKSNGSCSCTARQITTPSSAFWPRRSRSKALITVRISPRRRCGPW